MADKRIIDMAELAEASSGWYAMLDSSADGTRKYDMGKVLAQASGAAADAAGAVSTAQAAASDAAAALTASSQAAADASAAAGSAADAAEDAAKVDEYAGEVSRKANADGHETDLTAGFADNLAPSGDAVSAQFIARQSGGDGAARIEAVKGNTVVWNQLAPYAGDASYGYTNGTAAVSDGVVTFTTSSDTSNYYGASANRNVSIPTDHKVLIAADMKGGYANSYGCGLTNSTVVDKTGYTSPNSWQRVATIANTTGTNTTHSVQWYCCGSSGTTPSGSVYELKNLQLFDLTRMFGQGNEPATVQEFESLYPATYYPYDAGTLLPVRVEGVETVGFNQWDGETAQGYWDADTGEFVQSSNWTGCKTHIPCFPNTTYYYKADANVTQSVGRVIFYDGSKGYLSSLNAVKNTTFTTPANAHYMTFYANPAYFAASADPICINLSHSGYRNGEYEAYWQSVRAIPASTYFPDGMKSAGTVRDELTADKAVKRVGAVDLGTLDWTKYDASQGTLFRTTVNDFKGGEASVNFTCPLYQSTTYTNRAEKTVSSYSAHTLDIIDSSYTDAAAFKTAMSGVMLYYELATPTETEIDPPLNLDYRVSDFGTERIVTDGETVPPTAPVPMEIAYGNAAATLAGLPIDYISHASMARFIAAMESHFGVTVTETWDDANKRYDYTIGA